MTRLFLFNYLIFISILIESVHLYKISLVSDNKIDYINTTKQHNIFLFYHKQNMYKISFFLARRMFASNLYQKNIRSFTILVFIGIFIGSCTLALVTAIMRGFEITVHNKIKGLHADIILDSNGKPIKCKALFKVFYDEFPEIISYATHIQRHVIITSQAQTSENSLAVILLKSINPKEEITTSSLAKNIIQPITYPSLETIVNDNQILISKHYAVSNHINLNDDIDILYSPEESLCGNTLHFQIARATVGGIFYTGTDEFDSNIIYCSHTFLKQLFPDASIELINIALNPKADEQKTIEKLHRRTGFFVYSWKDLYPSLIATLKLEKYISFCILSLLILVASINIASLIHMLISEKQRDIALLLSIGMPIKTINMIFFIVGLTLSAIATSCGLLCAYIVYIIVDRYHWISLSDEYFINHLPISLEIDIMIAVFLTVIISTWLSLMHATKHTKKSSIIKILYFQ